MTSCASSLLFGRVGYFFLRSLYRASAPFLISLGWKWLSSKVCSSFLTTADGRIETSPELLLDLKRSCLASAFRTVGSYPQTCWFLVLMITTPSESVVIDFVQFFFMLHIYIRCHHFNNVYSPVHISIHYNGFISPFRFRVCYLRDFKNRFDLEWVNKKWT